MVDIYNNLLTELKNTLTDCTVLNSYPNQVPKFPCVILSDVENSIGQVDSSGEALTNVAFEISIFTNSTRRETDGKKIRNLVDDILSVTFGLNRDSVRSVANLSDNTIHRINMRYSGVVDKNYKIYRG